MGLYFSFNLFFLDLDSHLFISEWFLRYKCFGYFSRDLNLTSFFAFLNCETKLNWTRMKILSFLLITWRIFRLTLGRDADQSSLLTLYLLFFEVVSETVGFVRGGNSRWWEGLMVGLMVGLMMGPLSIHLFGDDGKEPRIWYIHWLNKKTLTSNWVKLGDLAVDIVFR